MNKPLWLWALFLSIVVVLLVLDLGVLHRNKREISVRESIGMCTFYFVIASLFGFWVWHYLGAQSVKEYFTGYLVELSLSMDNVFVIAMIFGYFHVPRKYQHRVLFWGILGAILMRGIMIGAGAILVERFAWILFVFAAFLIVTGVRMLIWHEKELDIAQNRLLIFLKKHLRVTHEFHEEKFTVRLPDKKKIGRYATFVTPLLLALILIEIADIIFAVDSVPAIFAITTDPYIVYTSNIFAILGLRSLYFALAAMINRFQYLKYALALVLIFIGCKVFAVPLLGLEKFPAAISLMVTVLLLTGGIVFSLIKTRRNP